MNVELTGDELAYIIRLMKSNIASIDKHRPKNNPPKFKPLLERLQFQLTEAMMK